MEIRDLEFRGIKIEHLGMYFEELGAKQVTDKFPYIYEAENWRDIYFRKRKFHLLQFLKLIQSKFVFVQMKLKLLMN